ncbi:hypothetical protein BAUCODRAFT_359251 [Baudoinia panamericana UAMH 10762]|uniref:Uncharacterized protein n=1 Tax=Baudoinia panamericana (strain UAMH 10762) TaxID=717646 RepID=M2NKN9_BAUPA|nr:uncharacterized protein BAUCODRAFT_359251 [Baudoinia panamericana UAMH 10762]EMC99994.1 hypothetical protein BAUCODRAFT_359251 [Baudoinia panamericana UAMH 10762]
MSSKFFTWTKGDRKYAPEGHRSAGVVPIPAECISIKGMDLEQGAKDIGRSRREAIPPSFDLESMSPLQHAPVHNESIALHDAAVQSATSLMAVMNDMLRSPHISAHLSAQRGNGLTPMYGRPRSHTAPSTPLVEAPSVGPVELPGSLLASKRSILSLHQSIDGTATKPVVQSPVQTALGTSIVRPRSSPQEATYSLPHVPVRSSDGFPLQTSLYPSAQLSPRSQSSSPQRFSRKFGNATLPIAGDDLFETRHVGETMQAAKRPSLYAVSSRLSQRSSVGTGSNSSRVGSSSAVPQLTTSVTKQSCSQCSNLQQQDVERALLEHITIMRSTHEAHLHSLREAHLRELESSRSYIEFLESRHGLSDLRQGVSKRELSLDTSHVRVMSDEMHSAGASATTQRSSSSLESQKRASQEAVAEAEALKRKLSLVRKAQAESGEVRRERDHLRDTVETSDRRIIQLKDIMRKSKEQEKTLRNTVADLEGRLAAANIERTDVLEGFHEASQQILKLSASEQSLRQEVQDLRSRLIHANGRHASDTTLALPEKNSQCRPRHIRTKSDVGGIAGNQDPILQQNLELRRLLAEAKGKISRLEQMPPVLQTDADAARMTQLQASLRDHKHMLAVARADSERYNGLLHSELRRQSRFAAQHIQAATPKVEGNALLDATEKAKIVSQSTRTANLEQDMQSLGREVEYCLKEIVLYKLDVRGYRKDLKKAQATIAKLQAVQSARPPTPDGDSASSVHSSGSADPERPAAQDGDALSGLGIALKEGPDTAQRTVASATAAALRSKTPPLTFTVGSPPHRPRTPMGVHKKLPKPPSARTPSPLPETEPATVKLQRGATLRSLSESIISSYAKRNTPELDIGVTHSAVRQEDIQARPSGSHPPMPAMSAAPTD